MTINRFCVFAAIVIACLAAISAVAPSRLNARFSFDPLVRKLEARAIVLNDSTDKLIGLGKPIASVVRAKDDGEFGIMVYQNGHKILCIYWHANRLYGAHLMEGVTRSYEKWYFCDYDLLREHVELSVEKQ